MKLKVVKSSDLTQGGSNRVFPGRDKKVALAIYIQGVAFGSVAKKMNKGQKSKIMASEWDTPNSYLAKYVEKDRPTTTPVKRTILSEIAYNYFISLDGLPDSLAQYGKNGKWRWANMKWWQRLEYHLFELADGQPFTYEIL